MGIPLRVGLSAPSPQDGCHPKSGKRKGGIKAHTIIKAAENVPFLIRYGEAARHDQRFLEEAMSLPPGSIITFDKG